MLNSEEHDIKAGDLLIQRTLSISIVNWWLVLEVISSRDCVYLTPHGREIADRFGFAKNHWELVRP